MKDRVELAECRDGAHEYSYLVWMYWSLPTLSASSHFDLTVKTIIHYSCADAWMNNFQARVINHILYWSSSNKPITVLSVPASGSFQSVADMMPIS